MQVLTYEVVFLVHMIVEPYPYNGLSILASPNLREQTLIHFVKPLVLATFGVVPGQNQVYAWLQRFGRGARTR